MVASHYSEQLNPAALLRRVQAAFPNGALPHQLAGIDQLHIGGIQASKKLLGNLETDPGVPCEILEIGAGLGGLQRLCISQLPEHLLLHYTTLDITPGFSQLNRELNHLCRHAYNTGQSSVLTGDGQQLAIADNQFDAVILQHSLLNMPAPQRCLAECHRVLKPGGILILHEVLRGDLQHPIIYPVPWASDATHSHLISPAVLLDQLRGAGFQITSQQDWSAEALEWRQRQSRKEADIPTAVAKLSPQLIFGARFPQMAGNLLSNLKSAAIQVYEIIAEK
ncbi:class I SAM-dependent methyltransferase [Aliamphritea hakodatensis]|uniref:class I SAM-dependent methyltransferase n=1 Tax=Aliamphritea hakodatensis TaxID=2895352 RepID=UPI0022FD6A05|nr:class I SAM-dependent methyltransferase [Aliamphritea hakodatensis]